MKLRETIHTLYLRKALRRALSLALAVFMLVQTLPELAIRAVAADFIYSEYMFESGSGTLNEPYLLTDEEDFAGLADNVAHLANYSVGKYFKVSGNNPYAENVIQFYLTGTSAVSIGSMGDDSDYYFKGHLDLNGHYLYLRQPLFGTIGEGASVSGGYLVLDDEGENDTDYSRSWGVLARRVAASEDDTGSVLLQGLDVRPNVDYSDLQTTIPAMGGLIGTVENTTDDPLSIQIQTVELGSGSSESFSFGRLRRKADTDSPPFRYRRRRHSAKGRRTRFRRSPAP